MPSMASLAPELLVHRMQKAVDVVVSSKNGIRVFSHHDADGVSAAAIVSRALERANIQFQTTIIKGLNKPFAESLDPLKSYLFIDMGTGQLAALEEKHLAVVLDHHKPDRDSERVVHVNTHLLGVDGTMEACASTLAFLFAIGLDHGNWDLAPIAVVGMVGDKQHIGGFRGVNALIVKAALEKGLLVEKKGMALEETSICEALAYSFDPFFCGISGRMDKAQAFLSENDFPPETPVSNMDEAGFQRLSSILALDMAKRGVDTDVIRSLSGNKLVDATTNRYIDTMVELSNSSGKSGIGGAGTAMLLGSKDAEVVVKESYGEYRDDLLKRLILIEGGAAEVHGNIRYFQSDMVLLNGALAGIGMQYILPQDMPFFTIAESGEKLKISARGTKSLTKRGLDLSAACRIASQKNGGEGGGHPIASGATVPLEKKSVFLDEISSMVSEQLSNP